ncbi:hypothetical protein KM043_014800 [Ampulex compressa]|nr:hypothetical protein KM043_014800 [Ampulex compressa]
MSAGNGPRRVRAVIQIDSSIHLVKEALPRYESVIYNSLPECVRTCRCLLRHHRYPLLRLFFHLRAKRISTGFSPGWYLALPAAFASLIAPKSDLLRVIVIREAYDTSECLSEIGMGCSRNGGGN